MIYPRQQQVELENNEVGQTPMGELFKVKGRTHSQGGIPMTLPVGTGIYSNRLKIGGKTMADRKLMRERQLKKWDKMVFNNPLDVLLFNTAKRSKMNIMREEEKDMMLQEQFNQQQQQGRPMFAYGGKVRKMYRTGGTVNNPRQQLMTPVNALQNAQQQAIQDLAQMQQPQEYNVRRGSRLGQKAPMVGSKGKPVLQMGEIQERIEPISVLSIPGQQKALEAYLRQKNKLTQAQIAGRKAFEQNYYGKKKAQRPQRVQYNPIAQKAMSAVPQQAIPVPVGLRPRQIIPDAYGHDEAILKSGMIPGVHFPYGGMIKKKPMYQTGGTIGYEPPYDELNPLLAQRFKQQDYFPLPYSINFENPIGKQSDTYPYNGNVGLGNLPLTTGVIRSSPQTLQEQARQSYIPINTFERKSFDTNITPQINAPATNIAGVRELTSADINADVGKNFNSLSSFPLGNVLTHAGNIFGVFQGLRNAQQNRPFQQVNPYRNFGRDALNTIDRRESLLGQNRDRQLLDLQRSANTQRGRLRNAARGINTLRALDIATEQGINRAREGVQSNYNTQLSNILGQRAQLQNQRDRIVMGGEDARIQRQQQEEDAYRSGLANARLGIGRGLQAAGAYINEQDLQRNYLNILSNIYNLKPEDVGYQTGINLPNLKPIGRGIKKAGRGIGRGIGNILNRRQKAASAFGQILK